MTDHFVGNCGGEPGAEFFLSASEDLPPTYALLKKLGVAEQIRGDMLFARTWRDNDCELDPDSER